MDSLSGSNGVQSESGHEGLDRTRYEPPRIVEDLELETKSLGCGKNLSTPGDPDFCGNSGPS